MILIVFWITVSKIKQEIVSHHSVVLHVAGPADRLFILHHIRLTGEDAVTVETAEVLQMPVLFLSLSVLITEDQLWTETKKTGLNIASKLKMAEKEIRAQKNNNVPQ